MSQPTPDARAVVRALDALTTQVKRIADHTANPATFTPSTPVIDTDDTPTTPDDALPRHMERLDDGRLRCNTCGTSGVWPGVPLHFWTCADKPSWLAAGTRDLSIPEPDRDADDTCRIMETRTCPPTYNGPCGDRPCARFESDDPTPWLPPAAAVKTLGTVPWSDGMTDLHGQPRPVSGDDDEEQQRTARRASLRNLLTRVNRGALTTEECARLWQHVETEMREHDTMRAVAAGNKRHVQTIAPEIDRLTAELEDAEQRTTRAMEQRQEMAAERFVIQEQLAELRAGRDGIREEYETLLGRWRVAQAAVERVRALADQWDNALAPARSQYSGPVRAALDGAEQPTTEA